MVCLLPAAPPPLCPRLPSLRPAPLGRRCTEEGAGDVADRAYSPEETPTWSQVRVTGKGQRSGSQSQGHRVWVTGPGHRPESQAPVTESGSLVRVTESGSQSQGHWSGSQSQGHRSGSQVRVTGQGHRSESQSPSHRVRVTESGSQSPGHRVRVTESGSQVRVTGQSHRPESQARVTGPGQHSQCGPNFTTPLLQMSSSSSLNLLIESVEYRFLGFMCIIIYT